jgi:ATP-dependent DNA helicase RecG
MQRSEWPFEPLYSFCDSFSRTISKLVTELLSSLRKPLTVSTEAIRRCSEVGMSQGYGYNQILDAVTKTVKLIESIQVSTPEGLERVRYPRTALHEIITNAVLHRDYSIADNVHVKVFDNCVEVTSPGTLPGHVTPANILSERFARNGVIVRLINKFPNPPSKDVGEGLNTAFSAMRTMNLKDPVVAQDEGSVTVVLKHEPLATPEEIIIEFLQKHGRITNRQAREVCFIGSENKMKRVFQKMMNQGVIERVPDTTRYTAAYQLKEAYASGAKEPDQEQRGEEFSLRSETSHPRTKKLF